MGLEPITSVIVNLTVMGDSTCKRNLNVHEATALCIRSHSITLTSSCISGSNAQWPVGIELYSQTSVIRPLYWAVNYHLRFLYTELKRYRSQFTLNSDN